MKIADLSPDTGFVLSENIDDGRGNRETRFTFYCLIENVEKRALVRLYGCTQGSEFPPRFIRLNDRMTRPAWMSNQYIIHCHSDEALQLRTDALRPPQDAREALLDELAVIAYSAKPLPPCRADIPSYRRSVQDVLEELERRSMLK